MSNLNTVLVAMKDRLKVIPNVATCKIGLEANRTPADYPLIRLVPMSIKNGTASAWRTAEVNIYFGLPLVEGDVTIDQITADLIDMEQTIIDATKEGDSYKSTYIRTLFSDSQVEHYKIMAIQLEVSWMQ